MGPITLSISSNLLYIPETGSFEVMMGLIALTSLLLLASILATTTYLKNKKKLGEFLAYKQPPSLQ